MKGKNRIVAILLCIVMVLSAVPTQAFAADSDFVIEKGILKKYNGLGGEVIIPKGITVIGQMAFCDNKSITGVVIPEGVTHIQNLAFDGCSNLTHVEIPEGVRHIGDGAFFDCTSLTAISLPDSLTEAAQLFTGCTNLARVNLPRNLKSLCTTFNGCTSLKTVHIPESLEEIGYATFFGCTALDSITLPPNLKIIGDDAFFGCTSLRHVEIPASVEEFGHQVFYNCSRLEEVSISPEFTNMLADVFTNTPWGRQQMQGDFMIVNGVLLSYQGQGGNVVIPDTVQKIGGAVFASNKKLRSIVIPEGVTELGRFVFDGCSALTSVTLPNSLEKIGSYAFSGCTALSKIDLPAGVKEIWTKAFAGCTALNHVTVGAKDMLLVYDDVFANTPWLSTCTAGDFIVGEGILFRYEGSAAHVEVPDGVVAIASNAFRGCETIQTVTIPDSVTSIAPYTFYQCDSLTDIIFPEHLRFLSSQAFDCIPAGRSEHFRILVQQVAHETWFNPGALIDAQSSRITALANEITSGIRDDYDKVKAIAAWVSENIAYDYEFYSNPSLVAADPEEILDVGRTICDGYSLLTGALLNAVGIPVRYVGGRVYTNGSWNRYQHAWNEAYVDDRWVIMDTTWGMQYFDMDIPTFARTHQLTSFSAPTPRDIPSVWAEKSVWAAITSDLVPGDLQSSYGAGITRKNFCRLMVRLLERKTGQDIDSYLTARGKVRENTFSDTYDSDVLAAYALGIVSGRGGGIFDPNGSITRQEAAVMLSRTAQLLGMQSKAGENFSDADNFATWAAEGIAYVSGLTDYESGTKVMGGIGDGRFSPLAGYTTEQAIVTSLRLYHCDD